MKSVKHILLLTPGFPKDENDFNCIPPLQDFLLKFKTNYPSIRFSVITFQYPYQNKNYAWNGINVTPLGGKNSKLQKPYIWLSAIRKAKKIHKSLPVDVVHSLWLGECTMIGNILSNKFGNKHICTLMGQDVNKSNKYLKKLNGKKLKFIAISENQSEIFKILTEQSVTEIIHWGIDDQTISNEERNIDLLGVGSLIPLKNYELFITTVGEIVKLKPDVQCIIVGNGPELTKLKSMVETKGLTKNLQLTGLLNRTEIFKLMQKSKILLHPSKFEGFGFVFAEALSNGMQIVSFNVGGAQQNFKWSIAEDEKEFIVKTKNLLERKLNFDPVNLFPLQKTIEQYFNIYNS